MGKDALHPKNYLYTTLNDSFYYTVKYEYIIMLYIKILFRCYFNNIVALPARTTEKYKLQVSSAKIYIQDSKQ